MDKVRIDYFVKEGKLRPRSLDIQRIKSLLISARENAKAVKKIPITEETATLVFREFYESIRQMGDARWWSLGYEPTASHEVCMEILKEISIKSSVKLQNLDRFRMIRNSANYRGYKVSVEQAKEIADFWNTCASELIRKVESFVE